MQTRTIKLKLRHPNRRKEQRLLQLQEEFTNCARFHLEWIIRNNPKTPNQVHHGCYAEARRQFFRLPSSTLQQAKEKALAVWRSSKSLKRRGRCSSRPRFIRMLPLGLATQNIRVFPEKGVIRISTPDKFLWLPVIIPEAFRELIQLPHAVSEIKKYGEDWFVLLTVKSEDVPALNGKKHFGVDLGLANIAVLAGPGVIRFFDGKPLRYVRNRYSLYRQALQKKRKIGMVKKSKGRESRWTTDMNHKVSRAIVDIVAAAKGTLHVERLTGIRDRVKYRKKAAHMLHSWPFYQLLTFIKYKAALVGVPVSEEDPRYSSQRCCSCGHTEKANRTSQSHFMCKKCSHEIHADLNAARNLAARGACSTSMGRATRPLSGERVGRKVHRGNRNLKSSTSGSQR